MKRNPDTFLSSGRLAFLLGLIVLMVVPSVAAAAQRNVRSAQVVKRPNASTRHADTGRWTFARQADTDRDGLSNWIEEHRTKTNPRKFDTDGDGFSDGAEVYASTNPRSSSSVPTGPPAPPVVPPVTPPAPPVNEEPTTPTPPVDPTEPADTKAPQTKIDSGPSGTTTSTSASLQFHSSESDSTFKCQLDSGAWVACSSPKTYSSVAEGSHNFAVKATDDAGNTDTSAATRAWAVEPPADTTAPQTTINSGPSGSTTATNASFGFESTESDSTFQCQLDSGAWASCSSPKTYSSLALGAHSFAVKATDEVGNVDASPATRSWTVQPPAPPDDTTAPQTTIDAGPSGTTTSTSANFQFSSSEAGSSFQCQLDSGSWASCSSPKAYGSLALGAHSFAVKATDDAGNTDASAATQSWTVQAVQPPADTTAPQTTINSGPSGTTTSTSASFQFSSSESGSTFQCQLDSGSWAACSSPKAYSSLAVGAHSFAVKATDGAGNTDTSAATQSWTVQSEPAGTGCTQTLSAGANLSTALSSAAGGAVICLSSGSYSVNVTKANKSSMVTVKPAAGASPTLGYSMLNQATNIRFQELKFTGGIEALGPASKLQLVDNEFVGPFGFHANGQDQSSGTEVTDVLISGNNMHNLDYTGTQGTANGYGITASNGVSRFTITDNTIKSPASDYIQSASPTDFTVDHNTFLGPSLLGSHADHQDLWQIFGGGENIAFTNNVARNTETQESLLFQEGAFKNVVVENNLFDHDSRGYTCQIYQSKGLVFRNNTIVGSHWGCLFRDLASSAAGSGYQVDHNIFTNTAEGSDISTEGRAGNWGTYDYNVSEDGSAGGAHSVKNWKPSWTNTTDYTPVGLSFAAGYRP
jgi:flagellar hook assembly protein FlgD